MKKYFFLDRDGTLNIEKNYLYRIEDFELINNTINGLILLKEIGFHFVIFSNQSGIARGYNTEEDVKSLNKEIFKLFAKYDICIEDILYCPHHVKGIAPYNIACDCRKPKSGMFNIFNIENKVDIMKSWMVGDKISDVIFGKNIGLKTALVRTGYGAESENNITNAETPDLICDDLYKLASILNKTYKG